MLLICINETPITRYYGPIAPAIQQQGIKPLLLSPKTSPHNMIRTCLLYTDYILII